MMKLFSAPLLLFFLLGCGTTKQQQTNQNLSEKTTPFEKLIFHTSSCFGTCPVLHLELNADKNFKLYAEGVYFQNTGFPLQPDSSKMGYFTGVVADTLFTSIINEYNKIGMDTLTFNNVECCDASIITIIAYYKGKRKYLRSMFPPPATRDFISRLYDVCEKNKMTKSNKKFKIEEEKDKK